MSDDDAGLVRRALAGEKAAFGLLIDRYRPAAIKLARRMLDNAGDAEDLTQEALLQAFLGLASLHNPDSFGPWLLGIVVNLSKMRIRAKRDWHPADEWHGGQAPEDFTLDGLQPSPEAIYEVRELHEIVLAAVRTLRNDQQQTVRMHYVDGLTLWEIGRLAGVRAGAARRPPVRRAGRVRRRRRRSHGSTTAGTRGYPCRRE